MLAAIGMSAAVLALALAAEGTMKEQHAKGTFEVKVTPMAGADHGVSSGHLSLAKTFAGDLVGTSQGEMWTADTKVEGSAGYVAIEKIEGSLRGRKGSFTILHQATMRRGGEYHMSLLVVPDSGTDQLAGLAGTMAIRIEKGAHFYDLAYTLPAGD